MRRCTPECTAATPQGGVRGLLFLEQVRCLSSRWYLRAVGRGHCAQCRAGHDAPAGGRDESRTLLRQAAEEHQASTNLPELWKGMPYRDSFSPLVASRFWYEGSISSFAQKLRESGIALYIQGGWHDELRDQGLITWLNYPRAHLLIGPWAHCLNPGFELLQEMHRFFDTYLKGLPTGLQTEPPIHYFLQQPGGGGSGAQPNAGRSIPSHAGAGI